VLRKPNSDWRALLRQITVVLTCLGVTLYFAHHAINGRYGLEARRKLIERSQLVEFEIRSLEGVRARLQRDVALLRPDLPDSDLVEENAREVLGFAFPVDRIIARP
jgi:cell division protein FtsB